MIDNVPLNIVRYVHEFASSPPFMEDETLICNKHKLRSFEHWKLRLAKACIEPVKWRGYSEKRLRNS